MNLLKSTIFFSLIFLTQFSFATDVEYEVDVRIKLDRSLYECKTSETAAHSGYVKRTDEFLTIKGITGTKYKHEKFKFHTLKSRLGCDEKLSESILDELFSRVDEDGRVAAKVRLKRAISVHRDGSTLEVTQVNEREVLSIKFDFTDMWLQSWISKRLR